VAIFSRWHSLSRSGESSNTMPQDVRDEWSLRMWCAKEAVAKALGRGFAGGMQALQIAEAEVENGMVQLICKGLAA